MSYLSFNQRDLVNLEFSLQREILGTNHAGGYASTTLSYCNTSRYHGLLVLPIDGFRGLNHVLLSSLDETIIVNGKDFNLGIHRYPEVYQPKGHKYLTNAELDKYFSVTYQVGGVILQKDLLMLHNEPQVLIRYTLLGSHQEITLGFKPFLAFRNAHELSYENPTANTSFSAVNNGISMCLYEGFPQVFMQFSHRNTYTHSPHWHKHIIYKKDKECGHHYQEDLLVSGDFTLKLKNGESVVFSAATQQANPAELCLKFEEAAQGRHHRNSFQSCLEYACNQYIIQKNEEKRIKAGYPWHISYARDTFIALPGIALGLKNNKVYAEIFASIKKYLTNGLFAHTISTHVPAYYDADASLWYFWAVQQYQKYANLSDSVIWRDYKADFQSILSAYAQGVCPYIAMQENYLIFSHSHQRPLTWLDAEAHGKPILDRNGFVVEVNALWYNALCYALHLARQNQDTDFLAQWKDFPAQVKEHFLLAFWDEHKGYLADFNRDFYKEMEVRPSQIIACALPFSPLEAHHKKSIIDVVHNHLLTPMGLRSLSPKNKHYNGTCEGSVAEQSASGVQGGAHPWLLSFYVEACLGVFGENFLAQAQEIANQIEKDINDYGLCSFSEFYDGNPPQKGNGCISYAKNTAEILRMLEIIKENQK